METEINPPKPRTRTAWQVMWRLKRVPGSWTDANLPCTPLENEVWAKPDWAETRLKHYQKLSLIRVLEFRVEAVELPMDHRGEGLGAHVVKETK
jgi:hypothetical protein